MENIRFNKSNVCISDQFEGWTIKGNGLWTIENEPIGCNPLPDTPLFGRVDKSCFTTTSRESRKYYMVDLWADGLTPTIMRKLLPFQISCSQMYNSGAGFNAFSAWHIDIMNSAHKLHLQDECETLRCSPSNTEWKTVSHTFKFGTSDADVLQNIRYVKFSQLG